MLPLDKINGHSQDMESKGLPATGDELGCKCN